MADQFFTVNSGFFDAVDYDRTYSADDMTRPYRRVVSDGVFATQYGDPSTDLQVKSAGGMKITVSKGEAICGQKWFENPAALAITVPANTTLYRRIDSVIMQVDKTEAVRAGRIVYRTGTAAQSPTAPALSTNPLVVEYRLANISVAANATVIRASNITDMRGSADCPWVTGVITQVDTSTLFAQYQAAYSDFFAETTAEFGAYMDHQRESWEDFLAQLTSELDVTPNVLTYTSTYTATGTVSNIPIGIAMYNAETDELQVYINGIFAPKTVRWALNNNKTSVTLTDAISAGDVVNFVVFKSVVTGNLQSIKVALDEINDRLSVLNYAYGSPLASSTVAGMTDKTRIYVYTGSETGYTAGNWYYWTGSAWASGGVYNSVALQTDTTLSISGAAADAKVTGDRIDKNDYSVDAILCMEPWHPTFNRGSYVRGADGVRITGNNHFATTSILDGFDDVVAIRLDANGYEFYVSYYDATGAFDGTGFIGISETSSGVVHIPNTAVKIAITFARADRETMTSEELVNIYEGLYVYRTTDKTLSKPKKAADAGAIKKIIDAVSSEKKVFYAVTPGYYIGGSDGIPVSSSISSITTLIERANIDFIGIDSDTYEFYVAYYDGTGKLDGTGYIGYTEWVQSIFYLPAEAKKFALTIRRFDHAAMDASDATAIYSAISFHALTDYTLSGDGKPADAKMTGDKFSEASSNNADELTAIPFRLVKNGYIASGSADAYSETYDSTDYIDVTGYWQLLYSRIRTTGSGTVTGLIFYDAAKTEVSSVDTLNNQSAFGYASILHKVTPPPGAKYVRFNAINQDGGFAQAFEVYGQSVSSVERRGADAYVTDDQVSKVMTFDGVIALYDALVSAHPEYISKQALSYGSTTLYEYTFSTGNYNSGAGERDQNPEIEKPVILIEAGIHGNEKSGVMGLYTVVKALCDNDYQLTDIINFVTLKIIPIVSPTAYNNDTRWNGNGVNINRNFDTPGWEEAGEPYTKNYTGHVAADQDETQVIQAWMADNTDALMFIDCHNSAFYNEISCLLGAIDETSMDVKKKYLLAMNRVIPYWRKIRRITPTDHIYSYTGGFNPGSTVTAGTAAGYARTLDILAFTLETTMNLNSSGMASDSSIGVAAEPIGNLLTGLKDYYK